MNRFAKLLSRDNTSISKERGERIARQAEREYKSLIDEKQGRIDEIEDEIEKMKDMSTSNDLTTANRVDNFNPKEWIRKLSELEVGKEQIRMYIEIVEEKVGDYFSNEAVEKTDKPEE